MKKFVILLIALTLILASCAKTPSNNNDTLSSDVIESTKKDESTSIDANTSEESENTSQDVPLGKKTELSFKKAYDGFYYPDANFEDINEVCITIDLPKDWTVNSNSYYGPEINGDIKTHNYHSSIFDSANNMLFTIGGIIKINDLDTFEYSFIEQQFPKTNEDAPSIQPDVKKFTVNDRYECISVQVGTTSTFYVRISNEYVVEIKYDSQGYENAIDSSMLTRIIDSVSVK